VNATLNPERQVLDLVDIIDLKWLLSGEGHHVHVERLQADPAYAGCCVQLAAQSRQRAVRDAALRIADRLGIVLPARQGSS
jgi:hypothetical protein